MLLLSYESYPSNGKIVPAPWGGTRYEYDDSIQLVALAHQLVVFLKENGLIVKAWEIWNEENGLWYVPENDFSVLLCEIYKNFKFGVSPWDKTAIIVTGGLDAVGWFDPSGSN